MFGRIFRWQSDNKATVAAADDAQERPIWREPSSDEEEADEHESAVEVQEKEEEQQEEEEHAEDDAEPADAPAPKAAAPPLVGVAAPPDRKYRELEEELHAVAHRVALTGLQSAPQYNGKAGIVMSAPAPGDVKLRYEITLDDGTQLRVKPQNLAPLPGETRLHADAATTIAAAHRGKKHRSSMAQLRWERRKSAAEEQARVAKTEAVWESEARVSTMIGTIQKIRGRARAANAVRAEERARTEAAAAHAESIALVDDEVHVVRARDELAQAAAGHVLESLLDLSTDSILEEDEDEDDEEEDQEQKQQEQESEAVPAPTGNPLLLDDEEGAHTAAAEEEEAHAKSWSVLMEAKVDTSAGVGLTSNRLDLVIPGKFLTDCL